jgi:hypothetical protein
MPGYRYGVTEQLIVRRVAAPPSPPIRGVDSSALTWFEERVDPQRDGAKDLMLPPSRYAVDLRGKVELVVYGEQCLSSDLCFTWQRWNVNKPAPQVASSIGP